MTIKTIEQLKTKSIWAVNHYLRRSEDGYDYKDVLNLRYFLSKRDKELYRVDMVLDGVTGIMKPQMVTEELQHHALQNTGAPFSSLTLRG